jgi:hypothetical protein
MEQDQLGGPKLPDFKTYCTITIANKDGEVLEKNRQKNGAE